jgi:HK97 family phage portal protein
MTVLDRIAATLGYTKAAVSPAPAHLRADAYEERFNIPDGTLAQNQAELYQRLSWVHIAVSVAAQAAAGVPLSVKQLMGEDRKDIPNHEFERLLNRPNPLQSRFEFLESTYAHRNLTGNYYWWLNRPNERTPPIEMWGLQPHKVKPQPDGNMFLRGYLYYPGGNESTPVVLEPWEIVHFRRFHPLNTFVGLSPIEALATVAVGDLAMQKWNTNFFGKDNAKVPGFLAYADPINDTDWDRMKAEMKEQYGGTKRGLMMMNNVGKGGVQWVSTAMSQKDMEFLEARTFNKEEIFSIFAPGLSSVLAVNATEANATAGKSTLLEFAIWPQHVAVAEKITNDILPAYGPDLVAEFDDVRKADEAMELAQIAEYGKTHTINEVRREFYGDDPMQDERGLLLPAEVGTGITDARDPKEVADEKQARADAMALTMQQAQPPEQTPPEEPKVSPGEAAAAQMPEPPTGKALDLDRWQRKAVKRLRAGKGAACEFESEHISVDEAEAIGEGLKAATTPELIAAAFKATTPDDLTPPERALYDKLSKVFGRTGGEYVRAILNGQTPDLTILDARLRATLVPSMMEVMLDQAMNLAESIGVDFDPAAVATSASEWARQYSFDLVKGITNTTSGVLQSAVAQYQSTPGMTRDDLVRMLKPAFGDTRSQTIATTEITRASANGTARYQEELKQAGIEMVRVNNTNADDSVCSICGPLDGKTEDAWPDSGGPPWHVRCRCSVSLRLQK